jgi:predicted DNA-binding transcriptional regulator AlpA
MKDATQAQKTETKKTATPPLPESLTKDVLLRLPQVLSIIPIPKSSWWRGVKEGRYPRGIKLGERTTAWRASEIDALIERLDSESRA